MSDPKLDMLRRVPLFSRLDRGSLEEIARLADEVDMRPGHVLMREGTTGQEFFLILDGTVRVERGGRYVNVCGKGDFLGEIALLDGGPRTATAIADDDVRALVVAHREFHSLMDRFPEVRLRVLEALAARVRHAEPDRAH